MSSDGTERDEPRSLSPEFWRGYRVERVGGTVYLENEAGVEAFTKGQAEAYARAILLELQSEDSGDDDGLYAKYRVEKNGEPVENCFVLEPEDDPAARKALEAYADATDNNELAADLREWVRTLSTGTER